MKRGVDMKKNTAFIIIFMLIALTITGCGDESVVTKNKEIINPTEEERWQPYDPPIKISTIASYGIPEHAGVPKDTIPETQKWLEIYDKYLGVQVEYDWIVPSNQYKQKLDISIASGVIPDIMRVGTQQFELLKEADMLGDLSSVFNYIADPIKDDLEPMDYCA